MERREVSVSDHFDDDDDPIDGNADSNVFLEALIIFICFGSL